MTHKIYPSYKESNVNWLGLIPDSWGITKVKFNTYVKGRVGWHGLNSDEFSDIGVHLVTGTDFDDGFVNWDSCYRITEDRYDEDPYIQLQEGDLLITKDGTIGKLARVKNLPIKATLNSGIFLVRAQDNAYLEDYLYWILRSKSFDYFLDLHKAGSTIQHLYQEVFNQFSFPIPSKSEQLHLVSYLDRETGKLDTLISKQQHLIELLQEKRQAIISHAVTKGLNPDAKMKDSGVEWLGMVPVHWEILKGGLLGRLFGSESIPEESVVEVGDLPFIKVGSLSLDGFSIKSWDYFVAKNISDKCRPQNNFIVFPKRGAAIFTNKVNIVEKPSLIDPNLMGWKIGERALVKFIAYTLKVRKLDELADVSSVPQINNKHIEPQRFPVPPIKEQSEIIFYIEAQTAKIDTLIDKAKRSIELAKEHRTALISAAVTGKIDVRESA